MIPCTAGSRNPYFLMLRKFFSKRRTALWLIAGVLLLGFGLHLLVVASRPAHIFKIAAELGAVAQTREGVYPNDDGSAVVFYQETKTGMGTYLHVVASGKAHLLYEQAEKDYGDQFRRVGWSPDGRLFAYAALADEANTNASKSLVLFDVEAGAEAARLPASAFVRDSQFVWLTSQSFVYSAYNQRSWLVFERGNAGEWTQTQVVKRFADGRLDNLTAIAPKKIAWLQKGQVWTFDFATAASQSIWESSTNRLRSFRFNQKSGDLLLNCTDKSGAVAISYRPPKSGDTAGAITSVVRHPPRSTYVNLNMQGGRYTFTLKTAAEAEPAVFVWEGMLRYHALADQFLFFTGNKLDGLPGVWRYDVPNQTVKLLASGFPGQLKYTKIVPPVYQAVADNLGQQWGYHLWKPLSIQPGKKYPVILGQALHVWNPFPQIAVNAGYYYAAACLTNWINPQDTWPQAVTGMYDELARDPNVDTNRVYFIVYSAQAGSAREVLSARPNLCEGLILMRPGGLPNLKDIQRSRILMIGGAEDKDAPVERLRKYHDEAAKLGIPVDFLIQDGVQHVIRSVNSEREQVMQFTKFLLNE